MEKKAKATEDERDQPEQRCGKKRRVSGHVLHCDKQLDHGGRCSFDEDVQP
jgi:hypothetical protein